MHNKPYLPPAQSNAHNATRTVLPVMRWHIGEVENFVALQGIAMGGGCTKGPDVPQKIVDDIAKPYLEKRRPIAEFPLNELQVGWRHQPQPLLLKSP
jgi:hypothetical protein